MEWESQAATESPGSWINLKYMACFILSHTCTWETSSLCSCTWETNSEYLKNLSILFLLVTCPGSASHQEWTKPINQKRHLNKILFPHQEVRSSNVSFRSLQEGKNAFYYWQVQVIQSHWMRMQPAISSVLSELTVSASHLPGLAAPAWRQAPWVDPVYCPLRHPEWHWRNQNSAGSCASWAGHRPAARWSPGGDGHRHECASDSSNSCILPAKDQNHRGI